MFSKKQQIDCKKSLQKFLDIKRDSFSRLRHLRVLLDNIDVKDSKDLFEHHFTHIYHIFFDSFISLETAFKQRSHKTNKEELDSVLFIFEKILTLLPELLQKKWQIQSILLIVRKLLHHSNTLKIRQEGMRLFLIWYQIMGEELCNITEIEQIYASLVPGLVPSLPNHFLQSQHVSEFNNLSLHDSNGNNLMTGINSTDVSNSVNITLSGSSVQSCPIEPFVPAFNPEPQPQDITCYYLQYLMDYMITQSTRIYWKEYRDSKQLKCFEFLWEQFRKVYLLHIFPNLSEVSLYNPSSEPPVLRKCIDDNIYFDSSRFPHRDTLLHSQSVVLRWLSKYLRTETNEPMDRKDSIEEQQHYNRLFHSHQNLMAAQESTYNEWREPTAIEYEIIKNVFNSSRSHVNLMHSLFKEAFLLPFSHAITMRKVITVYRHWIYRTTSSIPLFIEEPLNSNTNINSSKEDIRAGLSNLLRVFVSIAANVFLLEVPSDKPLMLEEQVDMCKRVLNIYRYMVMKIEMDRHAWEQLLQVLLQITSLVLSEKVPVRKDDTLGGRLAPAFFQTLIVTWIKANLNVYVSIPLWEKFQALVSSLTKWEELIKEWSKTMDTLTRVMSRYVYSINLHDLPLERQTEKNKKKIRAMRGTSHENKSVAQRAISDEKSNNEMNETKSVKRIRSSSGDSPSHSEKMISSQVSHQTVVRSHSDSHLLHEKGVKIENRKHQKPYNEIRDVNNGFKSESRFDIGAKCRSLEFIDNRNESPIWSESSVSRSPSPTHSNVIENNSLKDSPMNIEAGLQNGSNATNSAKCVLVGGTYRGWSSESSLILWRRMLGILGDINKLSDPQIHAQAMECLVKVVEDLIKVKDNLGVSVEGQAIAVPSLQPPLQYFSSWLFKATQLPNEYKAGKLLAYKLLCIITIRRNEIEPSKEFLSLFYLTLRQGLITYDMEITSTIIKYSGPKFFSIGLPGSSCLLFDYINAANSIVSSQENKLPRGEALHLLGSLIGFSAIFSNILVLHSRTPQPNLMLYKDAKDHVLEIILNSSKREQTGLGRSIALSSLGIFLYQELQNRTNHSRMKEITNVLIAGTRVSLKIPKLITNSENSNPSKFNNRVLCRVACDMLRLQCDHSTYLLDSHPEIPKKIIEGLCSSLMSHIGLVQKQNMYKEYKNILLIIMFCLGQWCLSVPKIFLVRTTTEANSESMMSLILRCFSSIANIGTKTADSFQSQTNANEQEIDFTIYADNSPDSGLSPNTSPRKKVVNINNESKEQSERPQINISESREDSDANAIRLAANLLIGHLISYLGHFPQTGLGAARLSCLINENDDNLRISNSDTFDLEVLNAPNVLFFLVNNSSIVSFIELPEDNSIKEVNPILTLSKTPVRTIVRNLLGKFSWDCKQIHSTNKCELNTNYNKLMSLEFETEKRNQNRFIYADFDDNTKTLTKTDDLESLIQHLINTSPECINFRVKSTFNMLPEASDMIALLTNQHFQESRYVEEHFSKKLSPKIETDSQTSSILQVGNFQSAFQHCRQLIDQMGFLFWEKRNRIDLLSKNQNFVREIRNLDNQKCRETHKIAVIYVAKDQEDKESILLNCSGSKAFEEFVSGLGWEVNLETHLGFRGGLQQNKSTGKSAPYFANSFMEVIFHVSTRISNPEDEQMMTKKMRHLGNDEIHIVWSEHTRDYRRGIIPTEFCDALIVIYPLIAYQNLYYIQISRKPEVPFFGPLFNGAVVHKDILSGLVRATAINASRAKRMHIPYYLNFFEERSRSIDAIVKTCREQTSFEDFSSKIYSPKELDASRPLSGLSTGLDSASISSSINNSINFVEGQQSPQRRSRPLSNTFSEQRIGFKNN